MRTAASSPRYAVLGDCASALPPISAFAHFFALVHFFDVDVAEFSLARWLLCVCLARPPHWATQGSRRPAPAHVTRHGQQKSPTLSAGHALAAAAFAAASASARARKLYPRRPVAAPRPLPRLLPTLSRPTEPLRPLCRPVPVPTPTKPPISSRSPLLPPESRTCTEFTPVDRRISYPPSPLLQVTQCITP